MESIYLGLANILQYCGSMDCPLSLILESFYLTLQYSNIFHMKLTSAATSTIYLREMEIFLFQEKKSSWAKMFGTVLFSCFFYLY